LKAQKENSQASKTPKPLPKVEVPQEMEDEEEQAEESMPVQEKVAPMPPKQEVQAVEKPLEQLSPQERIAMEIEMLQNNGRFRVELLNQLQELNKAMAIIGGILLDLTGDKK